uniref:Uncharacterized protein n=1 Tax=Anguilla anguilla TaxID=7936 RepID=A0A0E9PQQ4_ANGAN
MCQVQRESSDQSRTRTADPRCL